MDKKLLFVEWARSSKVNRVLAIVFVTSLIVFIATVIGVAALAGSGGIDPRQAVFAVGLTGLLFSAASAITAFILGLNVAIDAFIAMANDAW